MFGVVLSHPPIGRARLVAIVEIIIVVALVSTLGNEVKLT